MRIRALFILTLLCVSPVQAAAPFTPLFNGKNLDGWTCMGTPASFKVDGGCIMTTGAHPYPAWLRSEKQYENFVLRFSYKTKGWYEGGFLVHAPLDGPGSKLGFKIHLRHDNHPYGLRSPGAIYDAAKPVAFPGFGAGKWNRVEVRCDWPMLRVTLNGTLIHDLDMSKNPALAHRLRRGHLGIQNICNSPAWFKDIEIRPLPDKDRWTDVFADGLDSLKLTGGSKWTFDPKTKSVAARGNNAMAFTKKEFAAPYELQAWVKTMPNGNGGIVFNNGGRRGVEIQCFNVPDSTNPTGSLYGIAPAKRVVSRDGEWFLIHLVNRGKHAEVFVNGEKVAETDALKPPYKGRIGFQQHTPNGKISYRGARIRKIGGK